MKAAWYNSFGSAEEVLNIGEFDTPEPGEGEVKIKVYASGVNPSDTKKSRFDKRCITFLINFPSL